MSLRHFFESKLLNVKLIIIEFQTNSIKNKAFTDCYSAEEYALETSAKKDLKKELSENI